jgi:penicillin-binding protein 1B
MIHFSPGQRRSLKVGLLATASVAVLAFAAWLLALDREVRVRFAGARWALPAQVYASPTLVYPGLNLGRKAFLRILHAAAARRERLAHHAARVQTRVRPRTGQHAHAGVMADGSRRSDGMGRSR